MGDNEYSNNNINNKDSSITNDEFIVRVPQIKALFTKDEKKTGNTI